jgi:hypothetical protein
MAGELQFDGGPGYTGDTIYFTLKNTSGQVYNGATFEAYVDANIGTYDIPATEQGTNSGLFVADMPAVAGGVYSFTAWVQAGVNPAVGDILAGTGEIQWSGTAELGLADLAPEAGAIEYTYTVTDAATGNPIEGVDVWATTDLGGANIVWRGTTDTFGVARDAANKRPWLDAGIYYFWCQLAGYSFTNPDTEVVS